MNENNLDLIGQFTRIEWLLHRYHQQNHTHHGPMGDPRRGQGRVLAILKIQPEISQKDLSYLLDMRPQSLGELLSKLEKNGYITRTPSETDRRVMNIKLTQEGKETSEQEFSFEKLFECLDEEEQNNLSSYLRRVIETLEAQFDDEQPEQGFDPRERGDNPFDGHFGGHGRRGFYGGDSDPRGGMEEGYPEGGQYDPRLEMGRNHHGKMPFGYRQGMMPFGRNPADRPFNRRPGMGGEPGENPAPSQDKTDKE